MYYYPLLLLFILCNSIVLSQTQIGQDIDGEYEHDLFGISTSISGDGQTIAASSENSINNGLNTGYVKVYYKSKSGWKQKGKSIIGDRNSELLGGSIDLSSDGNTIIIGSREFKNQDGVETGKVTVYRWKNDEWKIDSNWEGNKQFSKNFGSIVCIDSSGKVASITSTKNLNTRSKLGEVKTYSIENPTWKEIGNTILGDTNYLKPGIVINLSSSGKTLAMGSPFLQENR